MEQHNTALSLHTPRHLAGNLVPEWRMNTRSRPVLMKRPGIRIAESIIRCIRQRWHTWGWIIIVTVVIGGWLPRSNVQPTMSAGSIVVTTTDDELNNDGDCSLREAIQAVNTNSPVDACQAGSGNDTITLPTGIYTLNIAGADENDNATGDLDIFATAFAVTRTLIIQGSGASTTVVDGNQLDRVFHLIANAPARGDRLVLRDLTVRNGRLPAATTMGGAGLLSWGRLELYNVIIENNATTGTNDSNTGGGFCIGCGPGTGSGYLENVIVRNNAAVRGGGVFSNRPLTITASSIISNTAVARGAIENYGALTLINVTVSNNIASNNTGGIGHFAGSLSVLNSTISHNTSRGILFDAPATLKNTLLAHNTPGGNCFISTPPTSQGHNLSSDTSCAGALTASGDLNNIDPLLGPLQNNGGVTPTRALALASPAVNAGTNSGCPTTDQRGVARPQDGTCDIGAYELQVRWVHLPVVLKQ